MNGKWWFPCDLKVGLLLLTAIALPLKAATVSLTGKTGWTAVLSGANHDPVNDTQAGAADTDIVVG
jgi:hypothetical protein